MCLLLATGTARALEPGAVCEDARVRIHHPPDERWLASIVRACEEIGAMPDNDPDARVRIVPVDGDLIVEVTLKDGRSTLRRVTSPASLLPTLEALLTVPPARPEPAAPAPEPAPPPSVAEPRYRPPLPPPLPQPPSFGIELGGALGGRVSGAQGYLSFAPSGFAALRAGSWLLGMTVRWDVFETKAGLAANNFEMETLGAGLSVARRFRPAIGSMDVGVGPRLITETQSYDAASGERSGSLTDVRLASFARFALGQSELRGYLEADAELSPARIRRVISIDPDLPSLPAWSVGVGAGLAWGQP